MTGERLTLTGGVVEDQVNRRACAILVICVLPLAHATTFAQTPATQNASDPTLDWVLEQGQATTAAEPATAPATQPAAPFIREPAKDARSAVVTLSDGTILRGSVTTTQGKPIRIFDEATADYRDVPLRLVASVEARVVWERDEPEWRFTESGSDVKESTGRTYPARELVYTVTLVNSQTITGSVVAPLYLETAAGRRTLVLHKRQKGDVGQQLGQLAYVKRVEFGDGDK